MLLFRLKVFAVRRVSSLRQQPTPNSLLPAILTSRDGSLDDLCNLDFHPLLLRVGCANTFLPYLILRRRILRGAAVDRHILRGRLRS